VTACPKPRKTRKPPRKALMRKLDAICRQIVAWRNETCVEADMDGCHCGGVLQWGHVIPQGQSSWLKHDLSNSARQCAYHNLRHKYGDPIYFIWYAARFGTKSLIALREVSAAQAGKKRTIPELEEQLAALTRLYEERFSHGTDTLAELVEAGYYGEVVRDVWVKEGRV